MFRRWERRRQCDYCETHCVNGCAWVWALQTSKPQARLKDPQSTALSNSRRAGARRTGTAGEVAAQPGGVITAKEPQNWTPQNYSQRQRGGPRPVLVQGGQRIRNVKLYTAGISILQTDLQGLRLSAIGGGSRGGLARGFAVSPEWKAAQYGSAGRITRQWVRNRCPTAA